MDPFHYHPQVVSQPPPPPQLKPHQGEKCNNNHNSNNGNGNYLCRQTSTRWIPTSEQIRILRDLYYNCGMRSPNSEEIQRISAMLRKYGKIEGKNVFYWFQNHKARERQKKRITVDVNGIGMMKPVGNAGSGGDQLVSPGALTPTVGASSSTPSSSASLYGVAPTENHAYSTVPMLMERNLNIDFNNMNGNGEAPQIQYNNVVGGVELEIHASPWQTPLHNHTEQSSAAIAVTQELETLQLFPVKISPEALEPSNAPPASPNLMIMTSCCNPPGFYNYQQQQQVQLQQQQKKKQENQCMMYSSYDLQPGALELTLGSYLVSPPNYYNYPPGPM